MEGSDSGSVFWASWGVSGKALVPGTGSGFSFRNRFRETGFRTRGIVPGSEGCEPEVSVFDGFRGVRLCSPGLDGTAFREPEVLRRFRAKVPKVTLYFESLLLHFESILLCFESIPVYLESIFLYFGSILLHFESIPLYVERILLYVERILLYVESMLLYVERKLLYFENMLLYVESLMLHFESIVLYFESFCTLKVCFVL